MRLVVSLCGTFLCTSQALAGCKEDVEAAWHRTLETPFEFKTTAEERGEELPPIAGAFQWPSALRFATEGPNGRHEEYFIGLRTWTFGSGRWWGGKHGSPMGAHYTPEMALRLYGGGPLAFRMENFNFEGPVVCAGAHRTNGREQLIYEYKVAIDFFGKAIDHERIYVDAGTGLVSRREFERRSSPRPPHPYSRYITEFRHDAALKVVPPAAAAQ